MGGRLSGIAAGRCSDDGGYFHRRSRVDAHMPGAYGPEWQPEELCRIAAERTRREAHEPPRKVAVGRAGEGIAKRDLHCMACSRAWRSHQERRLGPGEW